VTKYRQYLQCRFVEPISSSLVASVRAYRVARIFALGTVILITKRFAIGG